MPRRLREGGGNLEEGEAVPEGEEEVHALAEKIARALLEKGGKGSFTDLKGDVDEVLAESVSEADVEAAERGGDAPFDPIREKASRMGLGTGPVDPKALREQFNKSLDVLKKDESEEEGEVDMLEAKRHLSREKEKEVVKSMTPWEAEEEEGAESRAAAPDTGAAIDPFHPDNRAAGDRCGGDGDQVAARRQRQGEPPGYADPGRVGQLGRIVAGRLVCSQRIGPIEGAV